MCMHICTHNIERQLGLFFVVRKKAIMWESRVHKRNFRTFFFQPPFFVFFLAMRLVPSHHVSVFSLCNGCGALCVCFPFCLVGWCAAIIGLGNASPFTREFSCFKFRRQVSSLQPQERDDGTTTSPFNPTPLWQTMQWFQSFSTFFFFGIRPFQTAHFLVGSSVGSTLSLTQIVANVARPTPPVLPMHCPLLVFSGRRSHHAGFWQLSLSQNQACRFHRVPWRVPWRQFHRVIECVMVLLDNNNKWMNDENNLGQKAGTFAFDGPGGKVTLPGQDGSLSRGEIRSSFGWPSEEKHHYW